ncbi:diguanylate cyclase domain-containing protein [Chitinilyticum piscinae]|uniref:diguanylate cyclase n=1 Tax=Chitinilyticum piscinae TaxID=2866724 RepID=A0A8J7FYN3_9NEIS|nr:diguanylate cyclase [Chitinilyticum piscinae]MBE9608108.1 diguanylate cyclase [Chitinilyticum piscinae]
MMIESSYVLVVDDQMSNIELLGELLGDDYDIRFALDAESALRLIAQQAPELILLDVMMPVMDGYQLCARLKAEPATRDLPIIFLTALSSPEEETRGLEAGAVDYITKPFTPAVVRARVRNHIELKRSKDILLALSQTDVLTGLANRRFLFDRLASLLPDPEEHSRSLGLILTDVDDFKLYNDSFGHPAGDLCLQRIAGVMRAALRSQGDLAARYGGEEFCCLLPDATEELTTQIAERIRREVEALKIPHCRQARHPHVTLSIGITSKPAGQHQPINKLLSLADQALYQAKANGRNRVEKLLPDGDDSNIPK